MCVCVCVCVCACVSAYVCMCACVSACMYVVCVRACVRFWGGWRVNVGIWVYGCVGGGWWMGGPLDSTLDFNCGLNEVYMYQSDGDRSGDCC